MKHSWIIVIGFLTLVSCNNKGQQNNIESQEKLEMWYNNVFSQAAEDTTTIVPDYAYATDWLNRYGEYITEHFERREDLWFSNDTAKSFDCRYWTMAYVDSDTIPELLLYGGCQASGSIILTQYDGKVYTSPKGRFSYIKGADGLLHSQWKYEDNAFGEIYEMKNGQFTELYSYDCTINFSDTNAVDSLRSVRQTLDALYYSKGASTYFPFPSEKKTLGELINKVK